MRDRVHAVALVLVGIDSNDMAFEIAVAPFALQRFVLEGPRVAEDLDTFGLRCRFWHAVSLNLINPVRPDRDAGTGELVRRIVFGREADVVQVYIRVRPAH